MRSDNQKVLGAKDQASDHGGAGRREFVKRAAYVTPVIATLSVAPAFAKRGSEKITPPKHEKRDR